MNRRTIDTIIESLENDLKETYIDLMNGRNYRAYFMEVLQAKYELMRYANNNFNCNFDVDGAIKRDKERYEEIFL